ncbi:hypothetical protein [Lactobacillus gasseri]|uniref:hypothetical protein n=1 Tax=Lactobacillus gasseri TaxID=1596 RepID=UPI0002D8B79E|nr:hypothetical protein [Lactobacillus gasseri]QHJ75002.1 hypothetical protein [Lactobacillus phage JNU_P7]
MIFRLEEELPFDMPKKLNEYWLNILERRDFKVIEINKNSRELEYRIELISLDDLRQFQKDIGLSLIISFEDHEDTSEVDGLIKIFGG